MYNGIRFADLHAVVDGDDGGGASEFWPVCNIFQPPGACREGNCDSPVPGTTLVAPGTCGDFDGDGRIGTAEDTDGSDRIFGTINAALGNIDLGATINATTAGQNGSVTIVTSGRFPELISIGPSALFPNPGNVQIEAAPGVEANINAVLSGDPAGGNNARQNASGITINLTAPSRATLRNLSIRNFATAVDVQGTSQVTIDNCRIENARDNGVLAGSNSRVTIKNSAITGIGYRVNPAVNNTANPGAGISTSGTAEVNADSTRISDSVIGVSAAGTSTVRMSNLAIFGNGTGIMRVGVTSVLASFLNNKIAGNNTNGTPTVTLANQ